MKIEQVKKDIQILIDKYDFEKASGKIRGYTEQDTKNAFISPLFEALGWNMQDRHEVSSEEQISGDRADYGFYLNERPKFYVEAKKLSADIEREDFAHQAIRYSWNKGVTWAVLTDFENIKVFCTQEIDKRLIDKLLFDIPYNELVVRFDQLRLLSKESIEKNEIDLYAEKIGKKLQRKTISSLLYEDLNICREILTKSLVVCNQAVPKSLIDEGVQKLLDRLIFLRVAEDRGIEPDILRTLLRESDNRKKDETLFSSMVNKFRELDIIYNSNLFSKHPLEQWEEYGGATAEVIDILRGKKSYYEYDFKVMPADILGSVYENYLGYKLSTIKSKSKNLFGKKEESVIVSKDAKKRKDQGIYYTPSYVVDYIVRNTLKPVLNKCTSISDLKKIKVLDPACGSGSFLIKALEVINEKYKQFGNVGNQYTKFQILLENIYGVDLDSQAVEIARLNLLINSLDSREKMPGLDKNIKNGNSLTINWQDQFSDVFNQGGFDVIIGNPPYIKEFVNKEAFNDLHNSPYYQGKMDLWTLFSCISIDLLKKDGVMGFIAPNNWVTNAGASIFRDKILKDGELKTFIDFSDYKVFEQAGIQTMIFIYEKMTPREKYQIDYLRINDKNTAEDELISKLMADKVKIEVEPSKLIGKNITFSNSESGSIFDKVEKKKNFELTDKEVAQGIVADPDKSFMFSENQ